MTGRIEKTVFISYRRTNIYTALAVYQDLTQHGYDVFFDYQSINSGDFETIISENIRAKAHFLIILSQSALERCNEPGDWLRREIEMAMDEKRNIVPLMMEGFDFGSPSIKEALSGKLATLNHYNGLRLVADYFFEAMEKLRGRFLNIALEDIPLHPVSAETKEINETSRISANEAAPVEANLLTAEAWFERGIKSTNNDEVIRCYTEAINLRIDFPEALNNRGLARAEKGDFDGAIADYSLAIEFDFPERYNPYLNRGNIRYKNGDVDGAINDYNEAIHIKSDFDSALYARAQILAEKGDLNNALIDFDNLIHLKPDFAEAYYSRGLARLGNNDLEGALADFDEAIRLEIDDANVYYNRGTVRDMNNLGDALADFEEAIRLKPDFPEAYNNRGNVRVEMGDIDGAIADYTHAIEFDFPTRYNPYINRGIQLEKKGDLNGAIADYTEAIRLNPEYADAYNRRGNAYLVSNNLDSAIEDFSKLIHIKPNYTNAYVGRGFALFKRGDLEGAIADITEVLGLEPNNATAYYNLGISLRNLGRNKEAEAAFQKAIELNPEDATAYYNLGLLLHEKLKRYEEAEAAYRKAIEINPAEASAYSNLGVLLKTLERYEEAEAAYRKAIELNPAEASAYNNLAVLLRQNNRDEDAIPILGELVELEPDNGAHRSSLMAVLRNTGKESEAKKQEETARKLIENESEYHRACFESLCGNIEEALALLKIAFEKGESSKEWARQDPDFENIRNDPRFKKLVDG